MDFYLSSNLLLLYSIRSLVAFVHIFGLMVMILGFHRWCLGSTLVGEDTASHMAKKKKKKEKHGNLKSFQIPNIKLVGKLCVFYLYQIYPLVFLYHSLHTLGPCDFYISMNCLLSKLN